MTGGLKGSRARVALLAAAGALVGGLTSAQAADLGGNCCADLEERIAELEATTARKGNRKVSLTVSGWVNEAVFFWDDGIEQNTYVGTNSLEQSRVKFSGEAKIDNDWSAGYVLELGINGHPSSGFTQDQPSSAASRQISTRHSNWFLKSKTFGKFTVGQTGTATYHLLDDANGTNTRNYSDAEAAMVAMGGFKIATLGAYNGITWRDLAGGVNNDTPGQNGRRNVVRYDTPEFFGFVLTGSWGEDDMAGVSLTYKAEVHEFKLVGKVGYEETSDEITSVCSPSLHADCHWWGAAGTIMHVPTGLYVYGGYGQQDDDAEDEIAGADGTDTMWFIQAGIEQKFISCGKTTIFGEYRNDDVGSNLGKNVGTADLNFWAGGVVQNIEAAAMDFYMIYRHADGDYFDLATVANVPVDNFDMVITGARIQF